VRWSESLHTVVSRTVFETVRTPSFSYLGVLGSATQVRGRRIKQGRLLLSLFYSLTQTPTSFPEVDKTGRNIDSYNKNNINDRPSN